MKFKMIHDVIREQVKRAAPNGNVDALAEKYVSAYEGAGLTAEEAWEECVCDALGGMNEFGRAFESESGNYADAQQQLRSAARETQGARAPPSRSGTKFSADRKADRPERRRALEQGEMVNKFRDKVDWVRYYEKIQSAEFDSDNYEDGDIAYMNLNGQLLTLEMQRNGEFSVIGMEGKYDAEVARYSDSNDEGIVEQRLSAERKGNRSGRDADASRERAGHRGRGDENDDTSRSRQSGSTVSEGGVDTETTSNNDAMYSRRLSELDALREQNEEEYRGI